MELFLMLLLTLILLVIITYLLFFRSSYTGKTLPPGSYGWPIIGETIPYLSAASKGNIREFIRKRSSPSASAGGGGIIKSSLFGSKCIILSGPEAVKFISTNEKKLINGWRPLSTQKIFPSSLIYPVEDDPKKQRAYISMLFKSESIEKLVSSIHSVSKSHLKNHWQIGKQVQVYHLVKLFAFTVACKMFLSIDESDRISRLLIPFKDLIQGLVSFVIYVPGTMYYKAKTAAMILQKEIRLIIKERREILGKNNIRDVPNDLLTQMLITPSFDGTMMSEIQIIDYILGFLIGGHETTAATLTFTMKRLVEFPHLAIEVLKEQEEIIEMMKDRDELIWEDVQKMKKTWNFVCESMRIIPSNQFIIRQVTTDFSYEGYFIPKGWKMFLFFECIQMDPNCFSDPEKFDPSRFEENGPQPYTFFPFGGGARMCPGKDFAKTTILIFLHHIITTLKWQPSFPDEGMTFKFIPIPDKGFPVQLFAR